MKFEELDLNDNVLDALFDMNFEECTPVQENCIPEILKGHDLMGVAQTGTGKTAAYLLPILSMLDDGGYPKDAVNCVIMSPTRELAQQIDQAMQGFAYHLAEVSSVAVYGGNDGNRYDQEMKSMRLGADVVIATPGRLISHISMGNIDLGKVSFFVLDEADRMLDMGFSDDIMKIASYLPKTCQTIMFSATMPKDIEKMAQNLLKNPVEIKLAVSKPADKIRQSAFVCYETQKIKVIKSIFKAGDLKRVIVFSGSKQKVKQINQALSQLHINSGEMHSDLDQTQRDDIMFKFKSGQIDVLVATDIVSRGIDIDDIAMVINYDVPRDVEDYVHRIGRTARADRDGVAVTLVNEDDMYAFHQIEKFLDKEIEKTPLPEGMKEGPQYVTEKNARRMPGGKRRRNDREDADSRKNRQRNRKRDDVAHRNDKAENVEDGQQNKVVDDEKQDRRHHHKAQRNGQNTQHDGQNPKEDKGERRQHHRHGRNNRRQDRERSDGNIGTRQAAQNEKSQNGDRRKDSRRRGNAGRNAGQKRDKRFSEGGGSAAKTVENKKSGLKELISKPLKWLKSIGKK